MTGRSALRRLLAPALLALALVALALVATGCERRSQQAPAPDAPSARLLVTGDYGAQALLDRRVPPDQSAMRALRGAADVQTRYAGKYVSAMLGRTSDLDGQRDWFFFVNGVVGEVSAADVEIGAEESVWWDHRDWGGQLDVGAVVGLWPEPFLHGAGRPPEVSADPPLDAALRAAGAHVVEGPSRWRVRVGAHGDLLARDATWRRASADPSAAGSIAAIEDGRVTAFDADADARRPVPRGRALAVAVREGTRRRDGALLAVVGLDADAARAAAETIAQRPDVLAGRYAVVFDGAGAPLRAAGRDGP